MTGIQPFVVETRLDEADWIALQQAWAQRARARVGRTRVVATAALPFLVAFLLVRVLHVGGEPDYLPFLLGMAAVLVAVAATRQLFRRWYRPDPDGLVLGAVRLEFSDDGVRTLRRGSAALTQWSAIRDVSRTATHVFLWTDTVSALIVPVRDLPPGLDPEAVAASIQGRATLDAGRGATTAARVVEEPASEPPAAGLLVQVARRLGWRPLRAAAPGPSDAVILTCGLAALGLWLLADRIAAGATADFYPGGASGLVWYAAFVPTLALVLHRASSGHVSFRAVLAACVGALPLLLALGLAIEHALPPAAHPTGYLLLGLLALVHLRRQLRAASGRDQPRALVAGALVAFVFIWATASTWVYPHLWYADTEDEEEEAGAGWAQGERLLFEQADRIDAAARLMAPGAPQRPDVFFVGFAGVGEQKVFAEELKLAERVVGERYGAAARSLLLVNDRRDRDSRPLATVPGLRRALLRVGERMDPAEDVLFLMLTSHGSDTPALSVSNAIWPLEQLDATALRLALDASGIRWRVLVISACHSGAFIETLADPATIILASARKDRSSFGCSDEREITEFGAAFLRDALPGAESLESAFEAAKQAIAERERREQLTPSMPQAHWGAAIREHWRRIEDARRR